MAVEEEGTNRRRSSAEVTVMGMHAEKKRRMQELHPPPQPQFDKLFNSIQLHLEGRIPKVKDEVEQALHFEEEAQDDAVADRLWAARSKQVENAEMEVPGTAASAAGPVKDTTEEQTETADEKTSRPEEKSSRQEEKTTKPPSLSVRVSGDDGECFWDKEQWLESVTPSAEEARTIFASSGISTPKTPKGAKMSMDAFLKEPHACGEVKNAAVQKALEEPADEPAMEEQAEARSWQQGQPELKNAEGHEQQVVPAGAWSDMGIKLRN